MGTELFKYGKIEKYDKEKYLEKFIPLVIEKSPKKNPFSVYDLHSKLNLDEKEIKIFQELSFDIRKFLVDNEYAKMYGSSKVQMLEKQNQNISVENYIAGDNYGIQSSRSDFIKPAIQNANKITTHKPPKRSFLEIASWLIGSVAAIIAIYEFIIKKL